MRKTHKSKNKTHKSNNELRMLIKEQWLDKNDIKPDKKKRFYPKNMKIRRED